MRADYEGGATGLRFGAVIALLLILVATLVPVNTTPPPPRSGFCIACDEHGGADAILNVILFAPLGAALALNRVKGIRPVVFAALLSCAVEVAQIWIPGRDPSLNDVLSNTLGGGMGQLVARFTTRWLAPEARTASRLSLAAAAVATLIFALTGRLLAPAFSTSTYFVRWTPDGGWYRGRVLSARLGTMPLSPGRIDDPTPVRTLLLAGAPLEIVAIAGPKLPEFRSLFRIRDRRDPEIIILGPDRDDLVLRYRTRGAAWRLDQPDLRLSRAFTTVRLGDTLTVAVRRERDGYCMTLNGRGACRIGYTVGSGWSLLWFAEHLPYRVRDAFDLLWVAGLLVPVGYWARKRPESLLAIGVVVVGLFVVPPLGGLLATPPLEVLAAAAGWLLGAALRYRSTIR